MRSALIFAGQGAEEPAMGLALARAEEDAAALLDIASEVVGVDVPRALERGGKALASTEALQPVLTAVGLASARALARRGVRPTFVAGHSLGELTAACFVRALDERAAIALAAQRGRAMADAARAAPGGMLALRASEREVTAMIADIDGASVAALNAEDEVVVSGPAAALSAVQARFGSRAQPLRVAGPWHSEAMRSAVAPFRASAAECFADAPLPPSLLASHHAPTIVESLTEGLVRAVRFTDLLARLEREGVRHVIVAAPSRVVRSLVRRTLRARVEVHGADSPASIDAIARALAR